MAVGGGLGWRRLRGIGRGRVEHMAKRAEPGSIGKSSASFRDMLKDGGITPSSLMLQAIRGTVAMPKGEDPLTMRERVEIAAKLVQYELPRLAAIEADVRTDGKTQEEWLAELDGEAAERRLQ